MKVLFILTSHDKLGDTGKKTGFWVDEFAAPYYTLAEAGVKVDLASPKGGQPPVDPKSTEPDAQTKATRRFYEDDDLQHKLSNTKKLSEVHAEAYDALFYPGGHGPLWDLATDKESIRLIEEFAAQQKPVAAVCHGPAALMQAKGTDGELLVKGKRVAGFTNTEEEAVQLTDIVPFLIEDRYKELGADYSKGADWEPYVVTDGLLITGQNPASSEQAAEALLAMLQK